MAKDVVIRGAFADFLTIEYLRENNIPFDRVVAYDDIRVGSYYLHHYFMRGEYEVARYTNILGVAVVHAEPIWWPPETLDEVIDIAEEYGYIEGNL